MLIFSMVTDSKLSVNIVDMGVRVPNVTFERVKIHHAADARAVAVAGILEERCQV